MLDSFIFIAIIMVPVLVLVFIFKNRDSARERRTKARDKRIERYLTKRGFSRWPYRSANRRPKWGRVLENGDEILIFESHPNVYGGRALASRTAQMQVTVDSSASGRKYQIFDAHRRWHAVLLFRLVNLRPLKGMVDKAEKASAEGEPQGAVHPYSYH